MYLYLEPQPISCWKYSVTCHLWHMCCRFAVPVLVRFWKVWTTYLTYGVISFLGDVSLRPEDFQRAQKYCKWAGSALQYEDVSTAVDNLQKALRLLTTGEDK